MLATLTTTHSTPCQSTPQRSAIAEPAVDIQPSSLDSPLTTVSFSFAPEGEEVSVATSAKEESLWSAIASEAGTISREIGTQLAAIGIAGTTITAAADSTTLGLGTVLLIGGVVAKHVLRKRNH